MTIVQFIDARWILDSRGIPTVEVQIALSQNGKSASGVASVPSGASTGRYEALELRDKEAEFHGKGVKKAIGHINKHIAPKLLNTQISTALEADMILRSVDMTPNKSLVGANAILAVSMAMHRAFANLSSISLWQYLRRLYFSSLPNVVTFPRLMCNVLNGGVHADSGLDVQEFMIVPNTRDIYSDIQLISEVYHTLKKTLTNQHLSTAVGDEGGFAPHLIDSKKALEILDTVIKDSGYRRMDADLAMDCAANEFFKDGKYHLDGQARNSADLVGIYKKWHEEFNILSIEDPFHEDDIEGWDLMTKECGEGMHIIGDDLFVTNSRRFAQLAVQEGLANGILIKLNQIGSVSETCEVILKAKSRNYVTAVSHRSGETLDTFIADLSIASQSEFIKLGAPARGERIAKYNRLLEIKRMLNR